MNMMETRPTITSLEDTAHFKFPVEMVDASNFDVRSGAGHHIDIPKGAYQAVVRTDTRQILAIHGGSYKLTPHGSLIDSATDALYNSGIDMSSVIVKDSVYDKGAKVLRSIVFPKIVVEPTVGDLVEFRITIRNSYDGHWRYSMDAGARRLICLNGMTLPGAGSVSSNYRHTRKISSDAEGSKINNALEAFQDSNGVWRTWSETPISDQSIRRVWRRTLARCPTPAQPNKYNKKLLSSLIISWERDQRDMGSNLWTAYNTSTAWATHTFSKGKEHEAKKRREDAVHGMIKSKHWDDLIEA